MATEGSSQKAARELKGQGWKVSPYHVHRAGPDRDAGGYRGPRSDPADLDHAGPWKLAFPRSCGLLGRQEPALDRVPGRRLLRQGWEKFAQVNSPPVCVNPGQAFNCYWEMPFRKPARITLTISTPSR